MTRSFVFDEEYSFVPGNRYVVDIPIRGLQHRAKCRNPRANHQGFHPLFAQLLPLGLLFFVYCVMVQLPFDDIWKESKQPKQHAYTRSTDTQNRGILYYQVKYNNKDNPDNPNPKANLTSSFSHCSSRRFHPCLTGSVTDPGYQRASPSLMRGVTSTIYLPPTL
jgi:hypothetical protein